MAAINREHKDRLFCFLFGNGAHKEWTLSLYNAVNGSSYENSDDIQLTTMDDVVYMGMKNDVSFLVSDTLNIYEQQSTFNPNMPVRMLMYAGRLYDKYIHANRKNININHGHSRELMDRCRPLREYAWLIDRIRNNSKSMEIADAVDRAIDDMPIGFEIRQCLLAHRTEVRNMCLTEYNEAETMQMLKEEFAEEGRKEGRKEGEDMLGQLMALLLSKGLIADAQKAALDSGARAAMYEKYGIR